MNMSLYCRFAYLPNLFSNKTFFNNYLSSDAVKKKNKCTSSIKEKLMCNVSEVPDISTSKVTIVGAGRVGMACAIPLLSKKICNEICIIDADEAKVKGEVLDLQHGSQFVHNAKITGGTNFGLTSCSLMYIITAGVAGIPNESRLKLLERNAAIIKKIIPQIVKYSPDSVILMATNPVDILTYLAWKLSGFPKYRVLGSGTTLDSARFRYLISQRLQIAPSSCKGCMIGEHGDSSVAVWSSVNVSGTKLRDLDKCIGISEDSECWNLVEEETVGAGNILKTLKGFTNWAIGLSCASIAEAILNNTGEVMPVSTAVKGMYGIDKDIFLSLPCTLNFNGITSIVKLNLTPYELELLQKSAEVIADAQCGLKI